MFFVADMCLPPTQKLFVLNLVKVIYDTNNCM